MASDQVGVLESATARGTALDKSCNERRTWNLATTLWEHTLRDEGDYARHMDYIHFNPVKHGHARRVKDWPYSSFHRMVRLGVYPEDWAGDVREGDIGFGER
jgi:hypothetical protein